MADSTQKFKSTPVEHSAYPTPPLEINTQADSAHLCSLDNSAVTHDTATDVENSQRHTPNEQAISPELNSGFIEEYRYAYALQELSSAVSQVPNQGDISSQPISDMDSSQMRHTLEPNLVSHPLTPSELGFHLAQPSVHEGSQASLYYRQHIATQQTVPSSNLFPLLNSSQLCSPPGIGYMAHYHPGAPFDPRFPITPTSTRHHLPMAYAGPYPQPVNIPVQNTVSPHSGNPPTGNQLSTRAPRRSQQRNHMCPVCGKLFSRPSSLEVHDHTHTGLRPFQCPVKTCKRHLEGNWFSVRSNLTRHLKTCHTDYVPPAATT